MLSISLPRSEDGHGALAKGSQQQAGADDSLSAMLLPGFAFMFAAKSGAALFSFPPPEALAFRWREAALLLKFRRQIRPGPFARRPGGRGQGGPGDWRDMPGLHCGHIAFRPKSRQAHRRSWSLHREFAQWPAIPCVGRGCLFGEKVIAGAGEKRDARHEDIRQTAGGKRNQGRPFF